MAEISPVLILEQIFDWWVVFLEYVVRGRVDNPLLVTFVFFIIAALVSIIFYKATKQIFSKDEDVFGEEKSSGEKLRKGLSILLGFATAFFMLYSGYFELILGAMWFMALIAFLVFLYLVYVVFKGVISRGRTMSSKFGEELEAAGETSRSYKAKKRKHKLWASKQKQGTKYKKWERRNVWPLFSKLKEYYGIAINAKKGSRKEKKYRKKAIKCRRKLASMGYKVTKKGGKLGLVKR